MTDNLIKTQEEDKLQAQENMNIDKRVMKLSMIGSIMFLLAEVFIAI